MRVVVVDDEPELLDLVCDVLEDEGYTVLSFTHPLAVLDQRSIVETPQLFLVDLMLPKMDGIELAERLRAGGFDGTPMIAISASRKMLDLAEASTFFQATLSKPFDVSELLQCVERCAAERPVA